MQIAVENLLLLRIEVPHLGQTAGNILQPLHLLPPLSELPDFVLALPLPDYFQIVVVALLSVNHPDLSEEVAAFVQTAPALQTASALQTAPALQTASALYTASAAVHDAPLAQEAPFVVADFDVVANY